MRSQLGLAAAVLAIGTLVGGCAESPESDVDDMDSPELTPMGPGGSLGNNGLGDGELTVSLIPFVQSMKSPLTMPGDPHKLNTGWASLLASKQEGVDVLKYAAACSLAKGDYIDGITDPAKQDGHMVHLAHWLTNPLSQPEQARLFTCLAAHLNPTGFHVAIALSGLTVNDNGGVPEDFRVEEARWVTTQNSDGVPTYHVLPSKQFRAMCDDPSSAFDDRVCGQKPDDCHLGMMKDSDCSYDPYVGDYYCLGMPAVTTWLRPDDFRVLHPGCVPPVGGGGGGT